jgi:hypothetical protein
MRGEKMVDASRFPTCGELEQQVRGDLAAALDPLQRPFTWEQVDAALEGVVREWWSNPTFEDEGYDSGEVGDFMIRARGWNGSIAGYRTYPGGVDEDKRIPRRREEAP